MNLEEKATAANEAAKTFATDNNTVHAVDVVDKGRIADLGTAQEVAALENVGHEMPSVKDAADKAAAGLESQRQQEAFLQGLTPMEKVNMTILEGLTRKNNEDINTHAFVDMVDGKGRKYRILHPVGGAAVFFSKDGVFSINIGNMINVDKADTLNVIDWNMLGDVVGEYTAQDPRSRMLPIKIPVIFQGRNQEVNSMITRFNLQDQNDREVLADAIKTSEKDGLELAKGQGFPDPNDILSSLV